MSVYERGDCGVPWLGLCLCLLCLSIWDRLLSGHCRTGGLVGLGRESGRCLLCLWDLLHFLVSSLSAPGYARGQLRRFGSCCPASVMSVSARLMLDKDDSGTASRLLHLVVRYTSLSFPNCRSTQGGTWGLPIRPGRVPGGGPCPVGLLTSYPATPPSLPLNPEDPSSKQQQQPPLFGFQIQAQQQWQQSTSKQYTTRSWPSPSRRGT